MQSNIDETGYTILFGKLVQKHYAVKTCPFFEYPQETDYSMLKDLSPPFPFTTEVKGMYNHL